MPYPFAPVQIGLERCLEQPSPALLNARFGLLMNQASVDASFRYACDLLAARFPGRLAALFSPQHGLWCEQQANMIESPDAVYGPLGIPIYSLYSQTRQPTPAMLAQIDCLVIDLQDVGTRVYTFAWTIQNCLRACAAAKIPVVLLDRPNPLGGAIAEGPLLDAEYRSFVGGIEIPLRHGLTLGELALLMNAEDSIGADLSVVRMDGWRRSMCFDDSGRTWVAPSPNMPRVSTAVVYPGQVLLEGTNLSEGRGTTLPFEVVGAPFIDPQTLARDVAAASLPGVAIRPVRFVPTFDKWQGQPCGGLAIHAIDSAAVRSVELTLSILKAVIENWPEHFQWLPPPYEYEHQKMPIDILFGSPRLREAASAWASGRAVATIRELCHFDEQAWWQRVKPFLLYESD